MSRETHAASAAAAAWASSRPQRTHAPLRTPRVARTPPQSRSWRHWQVRPSGAMAVMGERSLAFSCTLSFSRRGRFAAEPAGRSSLLLLLVSTGAMAAARRVSCTSWMAGRAKAPVLPLPVSAACSHTHLTHAARQLRRGGAAQACGESGIAARRRPTTMTSPPPSSRGMVSSWTADGSLHHLPATIRMKGRRPASCGHAREPCLHAALAAPPGTHAHAMSCVALTSSGNSPRSSNPPLMLMQCAREVMATRRKPRANRSRETTTHRADKTSRSTRLANDLIDAPSVPHAHDCGQGLAWGGLGSDAQHRPRCAWASRSSHALRRASRNCGVAHERDGRHGSQASRRAHGGVQRLGHCAGLGRQAGEVDEVAPGRGGDVPHAGGHAATDDAVAEGGQKLSHRTPCGGSASPQRITQHCFASLRWCHRTPQAKTFPLRVMASIVAYLLPHGYPDTVAPSYTAYAAWTGFGMLFSSISGGEATRDDDAAPTRVRRSAGACWCRAVLLRAAAAPQHCHTGCVHASASVALPVQCCPCNRCYTQWGWGRVPCR